MSAERRTRWQLHGEEGDRGRKERGAKFVVFLETGTVRQYPFILEEHDAASEDEADRIICVAFRQRPECKTATKWPVNADGSLGDWIGGGAFDHVGEDGKPAKIQDRIKAFVDKLKR